MEYTADIKSPAELQKEEAELRALQTHTSKGEKLFNWLTYGGLAGIGTFMLTIPITYWAKYGGGAAGFENTEKWVQNTLKWNEHQAKHAVITTTTMQSGNITLLPVMVMERNKQQLVETFNNVLGDKSGDASVDDEPEQSVLSLAKGRVAAWVTIYSSFRAAALVFGEQKFSKFEDKFSKHIICNPLGMPTHIPSLPRIEANETKLFRIGKIAAFDVFATAAATSVLYLASRFFAKKNPRLHAHTLPQNIHAQAPAASPIDSQNTPVDESKFAQFRKADIQPIRNYTDLAELADSSLGLM